MQTIVDVILVSSIFNTFFSVNFVRDGLNIQQPKVPLLFIGVTGSCSFDYVLPAEEK
jgi:hypothetical protein